TGSPSPPAPLPERERGELTRGDWLPSVSQSDYTAAVAELRECIARGETYQVNYTLRLRRPWTGDSWEYFLELVEAQHAPYAAYVDTGRLAVCSASPELFFRLDGLAIHSRPMKGTAPRGRWYADDIARASQLARSEKDRAENAMVVDMIRNDLGKIARVGSVRVCDLFHVERYPTLWQMTSTVAAETTASVSEILAALFPCASVTGPPKPNTMKIIAGMETAPRGIYTGAIGMIGPDRQAQFNVAIRTVVIDRALGEAEYGVGGGVVWDSTPEGEYQECLLKARILTERRPDFSLLETMLWEPPEGAPGNEPVGGRKGTVPFSRPCRPTLRVGARWCPRKSGQSPGYGGYFLLDEHLRRLGESAEYFGFPWDEGRARQELAALAASLPQAPQRVRLLLSREGEVSCEAAAMDLSLKRDSPIFADARIGTVPAEPVRLELAARPVRSDDPLLYHKTTHRAVYEAAIAGAGKRHPEGTRSPFVRSRAPTERWSRAVPANGDCPLFPCDDVLLYNERGEITETCIANVVARVGEDLWTPPSECGLLAGVFRGRLLAEGRIRERVLPLDMLGRIDELFVINSVRKWRRAVLARCP
ncbi:MAG: aminodeoxychorismate synthase component I, partial [Thermoguttaceae bacterium]